MEEKELGKFYLGVKLIQVGNNLKSQLSSKDLNIPKEVLITELRTFVKMLEENFYPKFKGNITSINLGPEE